MKQPNIKKTLKSFGAQLAKIRVSQKITQEQLAEGAFLSRNYIGLLESNQRLPSLQTILKLQVTLGVELGALVPNPYTGKYK